MKKLFYNKLGLLLILCIICQATLAQSINISKVAKFKFGDDPAWANLSFNDKDWTNQSLSKSFIKDSSYAWYRISIVIPSGMKTNTGKGIKLNLGKIDDVDQTFFNGKLIGETGSFPPNYITQWEKERVYIMPETMVQWDKENIIAVRVYNLMGGMGMWEGPYNFEQVGWKDEVSFKQEFVENSNSGFATKITFTNKINEAFNGSIKYWISNKSDNKILFSETKAIKLEAKKGNEAVVLFSNYNSKNENVFHVGYQINDNNSSLFVKIEQLFIATGNLVIPFIGAIKPMVHDKVLNNFKEVPFQNQHFNGYLNTRFTQNLEQRLLKVDEFGLMGSYLNRPGIHPWAGEHVGKYLETACNVWKLTHNEALKKQMDRMMYELISTQLADGYLGTYTPDYYWTSWDVWSHKYNLHGLLSYYCTTGYKPALEACKKMGDLLCKTFGKKPGQRDIILAGEHMGMAATSVLDAVLELYKYTADKKYLDFCYYILDAWEQDNGPKLISSILAAGKVKKVGNGKAYEMLSNYVGLAKMYAVTGNKQFLEATEMAWQDVVDNQLYITGTSSSKEHFQDDDYLPATNKDNMGEGCVTTTWLQLNQNLFAITGNIKYLNELEKSVYNHLLGAENPQTGCVSYYTPLMNNKPYTCYITCCQSSVPRGIALVPNFTFGNIRNIPTVLFYEPAVYKVPITTTDKKTIEAAFQLDGDFPQTGNMALTVKSQVAANFSITLRVPEWCDNYTAKVGGKTYTGIPNQLLTIQRNWQPVDKVIIHFDMPVKMIAGGKSYPNQIAFKRGPQVLALDKSLNDNYVNNLISTTKVGFEIGNLNLVNKQSILPINWIGKQAYSVDMLGGNKQLFLVPFADASQTKGDMIVWLPLNSKN